MGMGACCVVVNALSGATRRAGRPTWGGVLRQIRGVMSSQFFTPIICPTRKELCVGFARKEFDAWLPASIVLLRWV